MPDRFADAPQKTQKQHTWLDEAQDLMRGVAGAMIIGLPLVYTMEMWRVATMLPPRLVLLLLTAAIIVNIGFNYVSGFRKGTGLIQSTFDSVEAVGLSALLALLLLFVLGVIDRQTPLLDAISQVAVVSLPLSIGVSVANAHFGGEEEGGGGGSGSGDGHGGGDSPQEKRHPVLYEAGMAFAGAVVFASSIAPTEEVILIATQMTWLHLIGLLLFSLGISYGMIFIAEFSGLKKRRSAEGLLQTPVGETLLAYVIALGVSSFFLWALHGISPSVSPLADVSAIITLGLPAAVGGAAGRLVL